MKRWWWVVLLTSAGGPTAHADIRPTLDDFYERTRNRAESLENCVGFCGDDYALTLLAGGQVVNPSTDAARPLLAEGPRLGVDGTYAWGAKSLARARAWADFLHVNETGENLTEVSAEATGFAAIDPDDDAGLDLSEDVIAAQREEMTPDDFAQFTVHPYRVLDVETEVAPHGIQVDKDGQLAVPLGYAWRRRWAVDGAEGAAGDTTEETRHTISGALALRGFQRGKRHHVQLDFARVTRTLWDTPGGELGGWALSAGYQHLSPGIDPLELWLLVGYGGYDGAGPGKSGFLAQLGGTVDLSETPGERQIRAGYDAHFVPDRGTGRFARVKQWRLGYQDTWNILVFGADYEGVALDTVATLHAFTPTLGVRPLGRGMLDLGLRYRVAFAHDERRGASGKAGAPDNDRLSLTADWLF